MLLTIVILLFIGSAVISIKEILIAISISKKPKPKSATDCYFCKVEIHKDTGSIKSIYCTHPYGKALSDLRYPLKCPDTCLHGLYKNENISYEKAINITSFKHVVAVESFRFLSSLIPTIIATIKLMDK